jgi:hypothetical protein
MDVVQTGSGARRAFCPVGTGSSFPWGKAAGREADHSPSGADVQNGGATTPLPPYVFML